MIPWIVIPFSRPEFAEALIENLERQTVVAHVCVVEVGRTHLASAALGIPADLVVRVSEVRPGVARNAGLARLMVEEPDAPVFFWDDDDWYGADYLAEALCAFDEFPEIAFTCKAVAFVRLSDGTLYHSDVPENCVAKFTPGATIGVRRVRDCVEFSDRALNEDAMWGATMMKDGRTGRCLSHFHFCYVRHDTNTTGQKHLDFAHRGPSIANLGPWNASWVEGHLDLNTVPRTPSHKYWHRRLNRVSSDDTKALR